MEQIESFIKSILSASSPMLTLFVLVAFGRAIKASRINDCYIPVILFIAGGIAYPFLEGWTAKNVMQGMAIGGGAVGLHQAVRQLMGNSKTGDTQFLVNLKPKE